jgi:transposase
METAALLADPAAIRLESILPSPGAVTLVVKTTAPLAECPRCHRGSGRVHGRYLRRIADLPWHGIAVKLELHTHRFRCQNGLCTQKIYSDETGLGGSLCRRHQICGRPERA